MLEPENCAHKKREEGDEKGRRKEKKKQEKIGLMSLKEVPRAKLGAVAFD